MGKGGAAAKARVRRYHELGLVEGITVEQLHDAANRTSASLQDYIAGIDSRNHFKNALGGAAKVYQSMDTVWKIHTFETWLRDYQKAYPGANQHDLEIQVARDVRAATPTYSEASKAARFWSRNLPIGPFAMFNAEMYRTTANRLRLMAEHLSSGNSARKALGARMMAGQAAALSGSFAVAAIAKQLLGVSDEEEEAIRQRTAPWQKNAPLIFTSKNKETGKFEYFDASYNDPFSVFTNPIVAITRGQWGEAAGEAAEPFISEDLAVGAMVSMARNSDENGNPVYDPGLSNEEQWKQIGEFFLGRFEPGTITSGRRIYRAAKGQTSRSGKAYDLGNEIASVAFGIRKETMDRSQSEYYRNREFERRVNDSQASIRKTFLGKGSFDPEAARQIYESAESERKKSLEEWRDFVDGSIVLGEENPYAKVVQDVGGESQVVKLMYGRVYQPYHFSRADLNKMLTLPDGEARLALYQEMINP